MAGARIPNELIPFLKPIKLPHGLAFHLDGRNQVVDPSGVPYIIDSQRCDVHLNFADTKVPTR